MKGESEDKIKKRGAMEKLEFETEEFRVIEIELGFTDEDSIGKLIHKKLRSKEIPKGHRFEESKKALNQFLNTQS